MNDAKALWTLPPKDVTEDQYKAFYKHLTHDYEDPLAWAHNRVEGDLEYTSLLYCPSEAPWDLYNRDQQKGLKLFVQRVFIMDRAEEFLPNYLRFIRGLVDTNDLPLNVSRELLQESRTVTRLKKALTKRALDMIEKLDAEKYGAFWTQFGRVLKEGVVEDPSNREAILNLLRFTTTKSIESGSHDATVSLKDYVERMPKGQSKIYYLVAGSEEAAVSSPYLETLKKKGVEVLLLWDRVDEWMMSAVSEFDGKAFVSATASDLQLGELADKDEEAREQETLLRRMFPSLLVTGPFSIILGYTGGLMALGDRLKLRSMVCAEKGDKAYISSEESAIRRIEPDLDRVWSPSGGEAVVFELYGKGGLAR